MKSVKGHAAADSPRRGRRPGTSQARESIERAARELFALQGFPGTSLRQVADRAGVDVRLISHYFGTKADLFAAVFELPFEAGPAFDALLAPGREGLGRRLAQFVLDVLGSPVGQQTMTGLLRAAASEEHAAALIRGRLLDQLLLPLARRIAADHAELRASLMGSQIAGLVVTRHIVSLPALLEADRETLVVLVGPVLEHYLTSPAPAVLELPGS